MKPVTKDVVAADSIAVMPKALDNTTPGNDNGRASNDYYGNTLCGDTYNYLK